MKKQVLSVFLLLFAGISSAFYSQNDNVWVDKFKQLKDEFATPNVYRTASGAPGHEYYQNRADYLMEITLDDNTQKLTGKETITYYNASPDALEYLWLQLDQNLYAQDNAFKNTRTGDMKGQSLNSLVRMENKYDGGFKLMKVTDASGKPLKYTVNNTMMRIDLPTSLASKGSVKFNIEWWYNVNNRDEVGGRSGYEHFEKDDNNLYTIAQYFPRMCVYNDVEGWQNKQFLGAGEFTLPFGDYDVKITVPAEHVVAATGELVNAKEILTGDQLKRLENAKKSDKNPVFIITPEEAEKNEKQRTKVMKTWHFKAKNVRDFAFASSRKFMWDAMIVKQEKSEVLAMSFYPKEGNPLWEQYSTKAIVQTLRTYSKHTFDYPYPVAISVHTKDMGMEYPMICFNGGRPEEDGTYSERTKYGMISVIIHEVGHNYFPMIINSDERQWTWMDEGLNTFLQYLAEKEWDRDYPSSRGPAYKIVDYMKGDKNYISPIMTNSESVWQLGNNAYGKPATALNILRETVMGRELFDFAFKTYAQRWMFKHPSPEDFFRTMEDASAVDLDWFWRGWFYTTDHVDIAIDDVKWYKLSTKTDYDQKPAKKAEKDEIYNNDISTQRNKTDIPVSYIEEDKTLEDFYNSYEPFKITPADKENYDQFMAALKPEEKAVLQANKNYYEISLSNIGGLVMPVILNFEFQDGSKELMRIPAEIWKTNSNTVTKVFSFTKELKTVTLDPYRETADVDTYNNHFPRRFEPSRFETFKQKQNEKQNPMQKTK
jgi:hypothetical protein